MSNPDTINLKEMADKATDKATNEPKKAEYKPTNTGESEEQRKQEEEETKITVDELFALNDFFEKVQNDKDMDIIHQIGTIFQKTDAQNNTTNWFNNIPTTGTQITKEQKVQLESFLTGAKLNVSMNIFVQKLAEFNKQRRNDAVVGLKKLDWNTLESPGRRDKQNAEKDILSTIKDPASNYANTMIKNLNIDGTAEYTNLLALNPNLEEGRTKEIQKQILLGKLNNLKSPDNTKESKYNNSKNSTVRNIATLIYDHIANSSSISSEAINIANLLLDGKFRDFQKLVYNTNDDKNPKIDGKLGPDTLAKTKAYLSTLITQKIIEKVKFDPSKIDFSKEEFVEEEVPVDNQGTPERADEIMEKARKGNTVTIKDPTIAKLENTINSTTDIATIRTMILNDWDTLKNIFNDVDKKSISGIQTVNDLRKFIFVDKKAQIEKSSITGVVTLANSGALVVSDNKTGGSINCTVQQISEDSITIWRGEGVTQTIVNPHNNIEPTIVGGTNGIPSNMA